METAQHIEAISNEGARFAAATRQSGLDASVPGCPDWDIRELVRHLGSVHLWAAAHVDKRVVVGQGHEPSELAEWWPHLARFWPDDRELVDWYLETNDNLVRVLSEAPDDHDCSPFFADQSPVGSWARRQAHETAIHRFDAESPNKSTTTYDPSFAADGIDEILMEFAPRWGTPTPQAGTMVVRTTDTSDAWSVTMGPNRIETQRGQRRSDVTLTGTASDLLLAVWNRGEPPIEVAGDPELVTTWRTNFQFTWD